jgi:hypothetical protein
MFVAVMRAVMHEQIPSIGDQRARKEGAAGYKIPARNKSIFAKKL